MAHDVLVTNHQRRGRHAFAKPSYGIDRSLIDAAAALLALTGEPVLDKLGQQYRYHPHVFLAPPWPDIYAQDSECRRDMTATLPEFDRLQRTYPALSYAVSLLPKIGVAERADFG